jgi:hypothetical protein
VITLSQIKRNGEGTMRFRKLRILALVLCSFFTFACKYVVLPEGLDSPQADQGSENMGWSAMATNVSKTEAGDLRVDLTIRNDTGEWSALEAAAEKPAVLTSSDGKTSTCDTVFVGTGKHRFPPGFQMRGFSTGKPIEPETQMLYVECKGAEAGPGAKLSIDTVSYSGNLDDYAPDANKTEAVLEVKLDEIVQDLVYPIATQKEGLIREPGASITGLSENVITLLDTQRTDTGFQFTWQNSNPTKFPLKTHIGTPPVIGADGIIYGVYETLDIQPIPITPAKESVEWTTEVKAPQDVSGFYILLSVETGKPRSYANYVLDISDK